MSNKSMSKSRNPKLLDRIEFGNPILRKATKRLSASEIKADETQQLIHDMRYTIEQKKSGVGLAAPQIGVSKSISIIAIKPTPTRPNRERFESVIINPEVVEYLGGLEPMWEGCVSFGSEEEPPYAQTQRYAKVIAKWQDETGIKHREILDGLVAHVFQHEVDHLNGVLFVDRVKDSTTWMNASEYKKMFSEE